MKKSQTLLNHEALDRTYMLLETLENLLGEHEVIQNESTYKALYENALQNLSDLYQKLGSE